MVRGKRGAKKRERLRLSTLSFFFGCCTSCRALFLDLLVRGESLKKKCEQRGKEGEKAKAACEVAR